MEILFGDSAIWLLLPPKKKNIFILEVDDYVQTETEGEKAWQVGVWVGVPAVYQFLKKASLRTRETQPLQNGGLHVRHALNISELHQPLQLLYTIDNKTRGSISQITRVTCQEVQ